LNWRKAVLPALWSYFDAGARGAARSAYTSLLPFLSTLPLEVRCLVTIAVYSYLPQLSAHVEFFDELLKHLWQGLSHYALDAPGRQLLTNAYFDVLGMALFTLDLWLLFCCLSC
jgi:hypothetical protein